MADREKYWMKNLKIEKGSLHRALGIPTSEKIPAKKLAVKEGDSPLMIKRKSLAKTFRKASH